MRQHDLGHFNTQYQPVHFSQGSLPRRRSGSDISTGEVCRIFAAAIAAKSLAPVYSVGLVLNARDAVQ